jgi:predicted methyltransferase
MIMRTIALAAALSLSIPSGANANAELAAILQAQPESTQARYDARHPLETLEFFGIKPGMTVVEALPGGGWYSKILIAALGNEGRLIGADYAFEMYPKFNFYDAAYLSAKKTWVQSWTAEANTWRGPDDADVDAFVFGSMPESFNGQADAVLLIRALHNLARFEREGGYLTIALADVHRVLKPGGIVGVVQHLAPVTATDSWADGSNGYLKQQFVIDRLTAAGFEFVAASDINLNPADRPSAGDKVWRLPPSLATSKDQPELAARYRAIGESTRMTLLFRKPGA